MSSDAPIGLVIETAIGMGADLALCRGAQVWGTQGLEPGERSARGLLPAVDRLLNEHGLQPADLRFLGLTTGPGSFTGLRVGVTFAKGLSYSWGCRILPINTFDVWARQVQLELPEDQLAAVNRLIILYDAQRGEWFTQIRSLPQGPNSVVSVAPAITIQKPDHLLHSLQPGDLLSGTAVAKLQDAPMRLLREKGVTVLAPTDRQKTLRALAIETWQAWERGEETDPFQLMPSYYRESAAEEKRKQTRDS